MKPYFFFSLFYLTAIPFLAAQNNTDSLDQHLTALAAESEYPGFGVALVNQEGVLFQKGYGFSNLEKQILYTENTIQNIGSVSKTFIGIALMKAQEQGKLKLDSPINDFLPFSITSPFFPETPITIRHLATHTSGITDTKYYHHSYIFKEEIPYSKKELPKDFRKEAKIYNKNEEIPLEDFIQNLCVKGGKWYHKKGFLNKAPGSTYEYSNLGAAIAAYILEKATGMPFDDYTQKYIFDPLGMQHTTWSLDKVPPGQHATCYLSEHLPLPDYSLITYPDGGLRTSVADLSLYLVDLINGYQGRGKLLTTESYQDMMRTQFREEQENSGIFWVIKRNGSMGHTGGDPGIIALMFFDPARQLGKIFISNRMPETESQLKQLKQIWRGMDEKF